MPAPPSQPRPVSRFARYALGAYALLIVYASLFPFSDWRWQGISPFDFAWAPKPRYITDGDLIINILGYAPLGWLLARALPQHWRRWPLWLAAACGASLLSFSMESLQSLLPMRVASNLDWGTNSLGGALGAGRCVWLLPRLRLATMLRRWRDQWFAPHTGYGLLLLALWPVALLWPAPVLFGTGQVLPTLLIPALDSDGWQAFSSFLTSLGLPPPDFGPPKPWEHAVLTGAMLLGCLLLLAALLQRAAPRLLLGLLLALAGLAAVSLSTAMSFGPPHALAWATPAALGGVVLGCGVGLLGMRLPPRWAAAAAVAVLLPALAAINIVGPGPYYALNLNAWSQGMFLRLYGLPQWLSWIWPFAALAYLVARATRREDIA